MNTKNVASPFSTGGGGPNFETRVQASFLVLMLANGFCPCLPNRQIETFSLQARKLGYETDDVVVKATALATNEPTLLLAQIKHNVQFTKTSKTASEVFAAAWSDFKNGHTKHGGALALITGPLARTDLEVRQLLDWARTRASAEEFFQDVKLANFSSTTKRKKLNVIRHHLKVANKNSPPTDKDFWEFLKSFHVLQFDLDILSSVNRILLTCVIQQFSADLPEGVWAQVVEVVRDFNQNGGTITRENLPGPLLASFDRPTEQKLVPALTQIPSAKPVSFEELGIAQEMAVVAFVGNWNDRFEKDREYISKLANESYENFERKIRKEVNRKGTHLRHKDNVWKLNERRANYIELAPYIFDQHLDIFRTNCTNALKNPRVEVPFDYKPLDKNENYSTEITSAFAVTLAIIAVENECMINCTLSKRQWLPSIVVREVLSETDWNIWATLNPHMPVLAEAAPEEFLSAIERLLNESKDTIRHFFAKEGAGFGGTNYTTGILWGLESLAWADDYLGRATLVLGGLDELDPGGNWANRAKQSLIDIYLPWHPQTSVKLNKKISLLEALASKFPETAWEVLAALLPGQTRSTSGTRKPEWRSYAPNEELSVTYAEYWEDVDTYSQLLLAIAEDHQTKIPNLAERLADLPPSTFNRAIEVIESYGRNLDDRDELRRDIWNKLHALAMRHERYAAADWSMDEERLREVERLATLFEPKNPAELYRTLFKSNSFDLLDGDGDWKEQEERLFKKQSNAVQVIWDESGFSGLLKFAKSVDRPGAVGNIAARTLASELTSTELCDAAGSDDAATIDFMSSYASAKFNEAGDVWITGFELQDWPASAATRFLAALPVKPLVWEKASEILKGNEHLYWQLVDPRFIDNQDDLHYSVDKLIAYRRPFAAIEALYYYSIHHSYLDATRMANALLQAAEYDSLPKHLSGHELTSIIMQLQRSTGVDDGIIEAIEWMYLPFLEGPGEVYPIKLERKLARDPDFFAEVIETIFRGEHEETREVSERERKFARSAYRLLHSWRTPPGTLSEDTFDDEGFLSWLNRVTERTKSTGRFVIAMHQFGEVLIHVPADTDGFWMNLTVAKALDSPEYAELRVGYRMGVFNSRGAHWVDPTGAPEDELANKYRALAEEAEMSGFINFSSTLREIAQEYQHDAERIRSQHQSDEL